MKLDHIGIAVKNLDSSVQVFKNILTGIEPEFEEVAEQKVRVAIFHIGDTRIELLEATAEDSAVQKFIDKKGEGVHHLAFGVNGIEKTLIDFKEKGITLIDETPRMGAGGKKIAFVHPKSVNGILTEITE
jgi:methylmalonyl-CoA/ethylmalonyl-CoA epimerase